MEKNNPAPIPVRRSIWIARMVICILSFGFIYPNAMNDTIAAAPDGQIALVDGEQDKKRSSKA